jgi:hypothetical protein
MTIDECDDFPAVLMMWLSELGGWLCKLQKGCTRLTAASNKVYHGRWFSPGTPASSTTKTGRHDIVEILLKVALNHVVEDTTISGIFVNAIAPLIYSCQSATNMLIILS